MHPISSPLGLVHRHPPHYHEGTAREIEMTSCIAQLTRTKTRSPSLLRLPCFF